MIDYTDILTTISDTLTSILNVFRAFMNNHANSMSNMLIDIRSIILLIIVYLMSKGDY